MYAIRDRLEYLEKRINPPDNSGALRHRYAHDAVGYVTHVLGVRTLTEEQARVLSIVSHHKHVRLLVPSANETGKSFIAACLCSWHYDCFLPSYTVTTAPAKAQVTDILFRELRRLRRGDTGFSPKADRLSDGDDRICIGYTAKDATSFQGRHDADGLGILDEAEGIDPEFWESAEGFCDKIVAFYNPTKANSQAAIEERRKAWSIVNMSALNHPNIQAGIKGLPPPIPTAVTLAKVVHRLEKWSTILPVDAPEDPREIKLLGVRYLPGPVAEARVLGQRPSKPVNAVFEENDIASVLPGGIVHEIQKHWPMQIGCDVARYGDDFTAIHVRQGPVSLHHESHNGWPVDKIARRLKFLATKYGGPEGVDIPIVIDDCGVGGGVVDLGTDTHKFIGVNSGRKSDREEEYPNIRSQLFFDFDDLLKHRYVDFSRLPVSITHDIVEQLRAAAYELDGRGRRTVLPKKIAKIALSRSPDDADALLLAYYQFPDTIETH